MNRKDILNNAICRIAEEKKITFGEVKTIDVANRLADIICGSIGRFVGTEEFGKLSCLGCGSNNTISTSHGTRCFSCNRTDT
jgi:hypothetical protein